jgi:glycosyltransferase involved in cell wall biosynthesis
MMLPMVVTVSIVIPLYQKESTIRRAIETTQRQSFTDF